IRFITLSFGLGIQEASRLAFPTQKFGYFQYSAHPRCVRSPQRKHARQVRPSRARRFVGFWKMGLALVLAGVAAGWSAWHQRASPGGDTARPHGTVTFNKDIAPVIFKQCAGCHRPGEAGPFPLLNYGDVKKHAAQIVEVTQRGFMPPWLPEDGHVELQ